jgi:hypothetical protein
VMVSFSIGRDGSSIAPEDGAFGMVEAPCGRGKFASLRLGTGR